MKDKIAIVTGASQGIGKAISNAFAARGAKVYMLGRSLTRLREAAESFDPKAVLRPEFVAVDLSVREQVARMASDFSTKNDKLNIFVSCGGLYARDSWNLASVDEFQRLLDTNVRGPYMLIQSLLKQLARARGDVVFINSSIVKGSGAGSAQFAATQHALRSLADSLRAEFNERGIRVMSIYPGRTATPRQEGIYKREGWKYDADKLLQPKDIAEAVYSCISLPETAEVTDLHVRQRYNA